MQKQLQNQQVQTYWYSTKFKVSPCMRYDSVGPLKGFADYLAGRVINDNKCVVYNLQAFYNPSITGLTGYKSVLNPSWS